MKILISIVHHWNPEGGGNHQSLRKDPTPRVAALQQQLLSFLRLGANQSILNMRDRAVYRANNNFRNNIDIAIITDGINHVLDRLDPSYTNCYRHVITSPSEPKCLGFEAHRFLQSELDSNYDLYGYFEDDLIINDPLFFSKISSARKLFGRNVVLLPNRIEYSSFPNVVNKFYIDGPIDVSELLKIISHPSPVRVVQYGFDEISFCTPENPHSGCFILDRQQLSHWTSQSWWLDNDTSFISPLESAATLGIAKTFELVKPAISNASWLEIQHFGTSFHGLIASNNAR